LCWAISIRPSVACTRSGTMTAIRRRWWCEVALDHPAELATRVTDALFQGGWHERAGKAEGAPVDSGGGLASLG
jgi:hypothetical protein